MKGIWMIAALSVLTARGAAAQDTTHAPAAAPPAPAAPAAPAAPTAAPAATVTVSDAVVAKTVVDRQPQDTGTAFPVDVGQLVCWTKLSGASGTAIHHVWGGSPWRTWSRKTVPADATGAWHVEVRDASGAVLKRIDFTVGQ